MILKTYQSAAGQLPLFCRDYRMSRRSSTGCCVDGFSANGQDPFPWSTVLCHSLGRHGVWSLLWAASFLGPEVLLSSSQQVSAQLTTEGGGILEFFLTLCHQCCANYGMDQNQTSKQSLRLHRVLTVISASNAFKEVLMNVKAKLAQVTSSPR